MKTSLSRVVHPIMTDTNFTRRFYLRGNILSLELVLRLTLLFLNLRYRIRINICFHKSLYFVHSAWIFSHWSQSTCIDRKANRYFESFCDRYICKRRQNAMSMVQVSKLHVLWVDL